MLSRQWKSNGMIRFVASAALAGVIVAGNVERGIGATIIVGPADDLQAALDRAQAGDVLLLQAGATYTGNFVLPAKGGTRATTLRSSTDDRRLPAATDRLDPSQADLLPKLKSPNNQPALKTAPGASHWRIFAVEFVGNGAAGDIIALGDGSSAQRDVENVPEDLVLDRILVRGDPEKGQKRGIALNSGSTTIRNSYIGDIKSVGQETQAIAGWNGPGPYLIENNVLEAAGVNILFGGSDPAIPNLVPSDITIRRNLITKNVDWKGQNWTVKNLLELKNARKVLIEGNTIENCWVSAQPGYAVLFTTRNSGGKAPWATIDQVVFQNNIVRHSGGAVNILGFDNTATTAGASNITIQNNLFDDIDHRKWGGSGLFLQIGNSPSNLVVTHNTVFQTGNIITAYGPTRGNKTIPGFKFTNNLTLHNTYGIFGNGVGTGTRAITTYFPDSTISANVMAGGQASRYPPGNFFPSVTQYMADFVDPTNGDYHLNARSPYRGAGTDRADLGVNNDQLNSALTGQVR
jgi:hypothetical protein